MDETQLGEKKKLIWFPPSPLDFTYIYLFILSLAGVFHINPTEKKQWLKQGWGSAAPVSQNRRDAEQEPALATLSRESSPLVQRLPQHSLHNIFSRTPSAPAAEAAPATDTHLAGPKPDDNKHLKSEGTMALEGRERRHASGGT